MPTTLRNTDILFNDGTTQSTAASGGSTVGTRGQAFTSNGTFTIPTGVTALKVTVVGGGGGGGGGSSTCNPIQGWAGGGGGTSIVYLTGLTPGNTISVTIGAGGTAGATAGNGGAGGNSSIQSGTQTITTVTGNGGGAGLYNNSAGGAGGSGSNATFVIPGQYGTKKIYPGGNSTAGWGGLKDTGGSTPSTGYGAGGSGFQDTGPGMAGTSGIVIFEW